ncbi:MAG: hypothetical protein ACI9V1_000885 [Spirosomataceae bacterium]|jgi:hypothetical protein
MTHSSSTEENSRPSSYWEVCDTYSSIACWVNGNCGEIQTEEVCETVWRNDRGSGFNSISTISYGAGGSGFSSSSSLSSFSSLPGYYDWFFSLNQTEKDFFATRRYFIPWAIAAWGNATALTSYFYCSQADLWNGNAFKHAMWNALLFKYATKHDAINIGNNHEAGQNQ